MPTVTYNSETFTCTTALKGADYIHLLDSSGNMIVSFDGVVDFSGFSITDGNWSSPTEEDLCHIAVIEDDGTLGESSFTPRDFLTAGSVTPASIGAAALDENGKVVASQTSSTAKDITASYTLQLSDAGKILVGKATSAVTITVPTHASVAFPSGTELEILQYSTGAVTISPASGVSLLSFEGSGARKLAGQYAVVTLKKLSDNSWLLAGMLE